MLEEAKEQFDDLENTIETLTASDSTIDTVHAAVLKIPTEIVLTTVFGLALGSFGYLGSFALGFGFTLGESIGAVSSAAAVGTICMLGSLRD